MRMIAELMTQRERDSRAEYCVVSIHSRQHNLRRHHTSTPLISHARARPDELSTMRLWP